MDNLDANVVGTNVENTASNADTPRLATLLLEAAARFVDLPAAEFDAVLGEILDRLGEFLQMEHVGLSLIHSVSSSASPAMSHPTGDQQPAGQAALQVEQRYVAGGRTLPSADELATPYPWYAAQLAAGHVIALPTGPDALPPEAEAERAYLLAQGVKSTLVIPLRIGDQLVGSLYFNSTTRTYTWPDHDLAALISFSRVLAGAAQRKQVDEALRRNEEQLGLAVDAAGIGIWVWDLEHPERSYGSANLSKIHGIYPCPKELSLQIYMQSLHADDRGEMEQLLARCVQGGVKEFSVEHRLIWPDGSLHWVEGRGYAVCNEQGHPIRLTGIMQEITGRKRVESQLEQQRSELVRQARMMEQTERLGEIGGWEWDISTNAYYWTPQTYRIFGLSPATYTPDVTSALEHFSASSATMLRSALQRATLYGESFDLKLQFVNAEGNTLWARVAGRVEMADGKAIRVYGSIQDITLRIQIEEQLRESQKLDAIGQLAGGIAHDFNNLLTTINGMSELSLVYLDRMAQAPGAETSGVDRVRNYIGEIRRAGDRAAELTRQMLAFSRKQVLRPKVLDLRSALMKTQEMLRQILGEHIELILVLPPHLGLVMADPSQIEQVIINLVVNGREAMPTGGTLTLRLMNVTVDEEAARQDVPMHPGNYVVLEVQDTGNGMSQEVQARLFDPFFTTKAVGAGSGLGLATVYGIVKQSGGVIRVESQVSSGTTFRIYLPQSTPAARPAKTSTPSVRGGIETILFVGDDEWARRGYRVALEAKGYRLLDAASGQAAITIGQSYVGLIHLLVVSVLTDMEGVALAHQILLSRPEMRVLFLESGVKGATPSRSLPSGYFTLVKPITPDVLAAKVRSVLDAPAVMPLL